MGFCLFVFNFFNATCILGLFSKASWVYSVLSDEMKALMISKGLMINRLTRYEGAEG